MLAALNLAAHGCAPDEATSGAARVVVSVAPLVLPGVDDACYDLRVESRAGAVWSKGDPSRKRSDDPADTDAVCSTDYGAQGGVTYIGPCSASPEEDLDPGSAGTVENSVTLWVDGLYAIEAGVYTDLGDWRDPCASGCTIDVTCAENADAPVIFDLTIMRRAGQGFFDFAVTFNDIFCSAKVDCHESPEGLLPNGSTRDDTVIIARACTSGPGNETRLLMSKTLFTCPDEGISVTLDAMPEGELGNQGDPDAGTIFFQNAIHSGRGQSSGVGSSSTNIDLVYVNQAIGIDVPPNADCYVRGYFTAYDVNEGLPSDPQVAGYGTYPAVRFDAPVVDDGVFGCINHPLDGGDEVRTVYVEVSALNDVDLSSLPSGEFVGPGGESMPVSHYAPAPETSCPNASTNLLPRALWVWQTSSFTDPVAKAALLAFADTHAIDTVYLQVGATDMPAIGADSSLLGQFIAQAHEHCIAVELLVGDPSWSLADHRAVAVSLAGAARDFATALSGPRPTAFHIDIEPHGIDGVVSGGVTYRWSNDGTAGTTNQRPDIMNQFLDTLEAIDAALAGVLPLHADIAFWLDTGSGFNPLQRTVAGVSSGAPRPAHELVIDRVDRVHVMAYRDEAFGAGCTSSACSANGIYDLSRGEVDYARSISKTAVVGVETGDYGDAISFFEESTDWLESQLLAVATAYSGHTGLAGFAIHDLVGYSVLSAKTP